MDIEATEPGRNLQKNIRSKSSQRMKYEAEIQVLKSKFGDLEDIRQELGLSRRKMCQLLMVDPSAWTRWTNQGASAPPHIYRSLQWYLNLIEKHPEWHPNNSFHPYFGRGESINSPMIHDLARSQKDLERDFATFKSVNRLSKDSLESMQSHWEATERELRELLEKKDASLAIWKLFVLMNMTILAFIAIWNWL